MVIAIINGEYVEVEEEFPPIPEPSADEILDIILGGTQ